MREHKNIYLYYECSGYQYKTVEAVDDSDRTFSFVFTETEHKKYLEQAKRLCESFEAFCTKECGFDDPVTCDVWFLDRTEKPVPDDFTYESLFDASTIYDKEIYPQNQDIIDGYREYTLDALAAGADWCCVQSVEGNYIVRNTFDKAPVDFSDFYKAHAGENTGARAVRAVTLAYKKLIDKPTFSQEELENTKAFLDKEALNEYRKSKTEYSREEIREKFYSMTVKEYALLRLYEQDRASFHKFIHHYLHRLNSAHRRLDSEFCDLIFNIIYKYYDKRDFVGYEECKLTDTDILYMMASKEDIKDLYDAVSRHEGVDMHEGRWFAEMPDEYVVDEIVKCYKTDDIKLGSMYILPDGKLLYIDGGHHTLGEYLYEKGFEKDYKVGQASRYLDSLGWIKANTKLKYIDLKGVNVTDAQSKRIEEFKRFMGDDCQILKDEQ